MRIVFMGSPAFAVFTLESLAREGQEIALVVTLPDKVAGRGRRLSPTPVKVKAAELDLPILETTSLKKAGVFERLKELRPDIIVLSALGLLVPPNILELPDYGCLNIHPSILPRWRGASPISSAIMAGDKFSGVSVMLMDEGLDTGPILSQCQVVILNSDTAASFTEKLAILGARFFGDVLVGWSRGEIIPLAQDESKATYSRTLSKADGEINWARPAEYIWRMTRAYQPWPGVYTWWHGKRLKIIEAFPLNGDGEIGRVALLGKDLFGVACGEGVLAITKLQLEGGRVLSAAEFLRGQRGLIGEVLPS
jgi:methionyl-tRNA formyltransferase